MGYTNKSIEEIKNWLKANLDDERYEHSIGAMEEAVRLALQFGLDKEKAQAAALLHDCAKCFPLEKLYDIIENFIDDVDESELQNYKTLHAPVGAFIAEKQFGVEDEEIIASIRWHTLGRVNMSDFEKIIFLSDKIEDNTRCNGFRAKILKVLQEEHGLDKAVLECYDATIKSLVDRRLGISFQTIEVYNWLLERV